jgi:hypothetical protein
VHRRLVHPLTLVAAGAALLLATPALPAQDVSADIRQAAAERGWMREYLRRYDALLSMQVALGYTSAEAADAQLMAAGRELHELGFHDEDRNALDLDLEATAWAFLAGVEWEIRTSRDWPSDLPNALYRSLATGILRTVRRSFDGALTTREDPVPALIAATWVLSFARGYDDLPPELDFFGGTNARAEAALPPIALMPIDEAPPTPAGPEDLPPITIVIVTRPATPGSQAGMPPIVLTGAPARGIPPAGPPSGPRPGGPRRPPRSGGGVTITGIPRSLPAPGVPAPAAGATPVDWGTNATSLRGRNGQRFAFACLPGGPAGRVWGTDTYTDDSSICTAAVHAGIIAIDRGGPVTVEIRSGQSSYQASERNGVSSTAYGAWPGSFGFVAGGAAPAQPAFAGALETDRTTYTEGQSITVTFRGFPSTNDWIALARPTDAPGSYGSWAWTDKRSTGTVTLTAPGPGSYEVRAFLDWPAGGQEVRARRAFTVTGAAAGPPPVGGQPVGGQPVGGQPVGGQPATGATPADWGTNATTLRGRNGQRFGFSCPAGGTAGRVWGTDVYTDDTSICTAGVHAGMITLAGGGVVTVEIRPGQDSYQASERNGIGSSSYGGWPGSFAVAGAAAPPQAAFAGTLQTDRDVYTEGQPIAVTFRDFPSTNDWIAIAGVTDAPDRYGSWAWTDKRSTGTVTLTAPGPGSYEVRAFLDWPAGGQEIRARRAVTVTGAAPQPVAGGQPVGGQPVGGQPAGGQPAGGQPAAGGGGEGAPRLTALRATYQGLDADIVTKGGEARPDGEMDGHVRMQASFAFWQGVDRITMYSADASGNPTGGFRWDTRDGAYWLLGVLANGLILDTAHVPELGTFNGEVTLDLYAGDPGWFRAGNYVVVELGMRDREPVGTLVPLTGGGPVAGGAPVGGAGGGAPAVTWETTPIDHRGQNGQRFPYACPPNGTGGRGPWGTALYTDDSSVCRAAVHAGLISQSSGGTVTIEVRPGRACYYGSAGQGGIASGDWGAYDGSYVFVDADGRPRIEGEAPRATARAQRESYAPGEVIMVDFAGFPAYPADWIEISPAGAGEDKYGEYKYLDGRCAGTLQFAALPPGSYEVRGRFNWSEGGYAIRTRSAFTVRSNAIVRPEKTTYTEGEPIVVAFEGFPGNAQDWIDISTAGSADASYGPYRYTEGRTTGTLQFDAAAPGTYEVRGRFNNGYDVQARATLTVEAMAYPPDLLVSFDAGWVGTDADVVGQGGNGSPDGTPDGHFTADLSINADYEVRSISVYASDANGNPTGGGTWHSRDSGYWVLGVARNGQLLNTSHVASLGRFRDYQRFDLYANTYTGFQPGLYFTVEADAGPSPVRWVVQIAGPATPPANACGRTLGTGIFDRWQGLGGENGFLGCPTADEMDAAPSPQGTTGRWAPFAGNSGMIVWHGTGARISHAYEVHGDIAQLYGSMGGSGSWLGFPISDEYDVAGGRRSDFEGGYILWTAATFETKAYRHGEEPAPPPPADQYRVTGLSAEWIGMDADVVPKAPGAATPDGESDGHLAVEIAIEGSVELRSVTVYSSDAQGNASGGQTWSTIPGSYWVLGVAAGGQLLHGGQVETVGRLGAGTTRLDLYAASSGWFNPGQHFVVEMTFADGQKAVQVIQVTGAPEPPPVVTPPEEAYRVTSVEAAWIGLDADVVSNVYVSPDGAADGHFAIQVTLEGAPVLSYATVYSSDASGNPAGGQVWHSQNRSYAVIGVAAGGQLLNGDYVESIGQFSPGASRLDLYAYDSGWFQPGQHFVVALGFSDGQTASRVVQVTGAAAPPPPAVTTIAGTASGHWGTQCQNGATDAGTFSLTLDGAGGVTGWYASEGGGGSVPVSGYAQPDGTVSGSGSDGYGQYTWSGQLQQAADGSLAGSGTIHYDSGDGGYACRGSWQTGARQAPPAARYRVAGLNAGWIGMDADLVPKNFGAATPDGEVDGHFAVEIAIEGSVELSMVRIYSSDAQGNPAGGQWWTTGSDAWILGVVAGGQLLNGGPVTSLGTLGAGTTRLDLYAGNSGWFNAGQTFVVELVFADGQKAAQVVQVTGAAAPPPVAAGNQCAAQGDGVYVQAKDGVACATPYALEAGRWYVLEASGTFSAWDGNIDRIDAVWCYTPDFCPTAQNWEQLQVDGQGLSALSAAAGGPSPLPYDPSHVYRVYVQGQGRPIQLGIMDGMRGSGGDNNGGFTVRIYAAQ